MTLLRMSGVSFGYPGNPVLDDVTLDIEAGERVVLLGRNGVGKTTLTRLVVALLHPDAGTVQVLGIRTGGRGPEDVADTAAYVFQHPDQQLFSRTVLEEATFGPLAHGIERDGATQIARIALQRVGLGPLADRHPYDLSPGERKLLAIGCAITQNPKLMVLDEPTHGLDRARVSQVQEILDEQADGGTALLAVTHDLGFAVELFHRAVVLSDRRVVYDGPLDDLVRDEARLRSFDLRAPPAHVLAQRLGLEGLPVRYGDVVDGVAARCRK